MRILVATDQWFPDVRGGVARLATESARRLAERGHDVTALVPAGGSAALEAPGLRVVPALRRGRLPQTFSDPAETARAARRLGGRFDVLLAHNSTTAAGLISAGLAAPLVTFFHASAVLELQFLRTRIGLGRERLTGYALQPQLARLERRSFDRATRILILSEYTRSLLAHRDPAAAARATRVPAGVDTSLFSPGDRAASRSRLGLRDDEIAVFTARRLVPRMGIEELIDAAALLDDVPGLRVSIAGSGPLSSTLADRIAATRVSERVRLLGRIPDGELVDRLRAADLFVLPTVAYEGLGMATIEALATGTPVVGTRVGATPEVLGPLDERLLADEATPAALASAVRRGLDLLSPGLRERCRELAVESYSWDTAIPLWEAELEHASQSGRPTPPKGGLIRAARALDRHIPVDLKAGRDKLVAGTREGTGLAVRATGLAGLTSRIGADCRAGILLYHNPEPSVLARHLELLARHHRFVSYEIVAEAVRSGDWSEVPPKSLAITFDDGHAGNAALLPVLEQFGVHATIFICTGLVGTQRQFWWTVDGLSPKERDRLMNVSDAERLEALERLAGWTPLTEGPAPAQALSSVELGALAGRVTFEAHTRSHPILTMCTDAQAEEEIARSKEDVEALTGVPCRAFAYPNGRYGRRELELVERAGFQSARTIETGWNDPSTDRYRLRVLGMPDDASLNVVAAQSTGLPVLRNLMYLS
jgi:glycosyltransferase involved in cell wall biosynthesis/peptidoglycan/xylan/chitin deacetylase (PgdA/CDA1 family)